MARFISLPFVDLDGIAAALLQKDVIRSKGQFFTIKIKKKKVLRFCSRLRISSSSLGPKWIQTNMNGYHTKITQIMMPVTYISIKLSGK
jgi:hypothetical protein